MRSISLSVKQLIIKFICQFLKAVLSEVYPMLWHPTQTRQQLTSSDDKALAMKDAK